MIFRMTFIQDDDFIRLGVSSRNLLLLEVIQELHPVVGGELPPARGLEDAGHTHRGH